MITEQDLEQAIAECQGERNPNANTCIKLAAFLTIKKEMFGDQEQEHFREITKMVPEYSYNSGLKEIQIEDFNDSDFLQAIDGKDWGEVVPVMDELMSTLKIIHKRLYDAVMRRL